MNCSGLLMLSRLRSSGVTISSGSALFDGSCLMREPVTTMALPSLSAPSASDALYAKAAVGSVIKAIRAVPVASATASEVLRICPPD